MPRLFMLALLSQEIKKMKVFADLFTGWEGLLVVGIIAFMLVMMGYLFTMFINKMNHKE